MDLQLEYHGTSFKNPAGTLSQGRAEYVQLHESAQGVSTECAEKVEAMLSTAVLHLADLWNMLTLEFSEGVAFDPNTALLTPVAEVPPVVLTAMKSKVENSLEWCQLARSRLMDNTKSSKQYVYPYPTTINLQEVQPNSLWPKQPAMSSQRLKTFTFAAPS